MRRFETITQLGKHDIGNVIDEGTGKKLGLALRVVSTKYPDSVTVNIDVFQQALKLDVIGVLFQIMPDKIKFHSTEEAKRLMDHARQLDGANYKIIQWNDIEGIPAHTRFSDDGPTLF